MTSVYQQKTMNYKLKRMKKTHFNLPPIFKQKKNLIDSTTVGEITDETKPAKLTKQQKQAINLRYLTCFVCTHNRFDITYKKTLRKVVHHRKQKTLNKYLTM